MSKLTWQELFGIDTPGSQDPENVTQIQIKSAAITYLSLN